MAATTNPSSTSVAPYANPHHLYSFHASFQADDTLVTILPHFDLPDACPLLSSCPIGPFTAGMPTQVPLWTALQFHKKSLCQLDLPEWLSVDNLTDILAQEKNQATLFHDPQRLPKHYYELATKLLPTATQQKSVLQLLVQDLLDLRLDKLRQQLPQILENPDAPPQLLLDVQGIGSQELALFRPFIQQALNDRAFLFQQSTAKTKLGPGPTTRDTSESSSAPEESTSARPRVSLRRFRR